MRVASRFKGQRPLSVSIKNEGGIPDHGPSPLPGSIQNEGAIPDPLAVPLVWFYPKGGAGSIQNEGAIPDHGAIPPYLVLSKMRVASWIMGPSPLSGIPVHGAMTPVCFHQK